MAGMMDCVGVEELLAAAALEGTPPPRPVEEHLHACAACRRATADYAAVVSMLAAALEPVHPPSRLRRSLMARVDAGAEPRATRPHVRDRWRPGRLFPTAAAVLAVAVSAVALWAGWWRAGTPSPATVAYAVSGTTAEPAAHGQLAYDPPHAQSTLTVEGLTRPVATTGRGTDVYEVWLVPAHGVPVAAGFLTLQPDGRTWSAVLRGDLHRYRAVAATLEPPGGVPAPTGAQVLGVALV